jgi:hypothetical protein
MGKRPRLFLKTDSSTEKFDTLAEKVDFSMSVFIELAFLMDRSGSFLGRLMRKEQYW